MHIKNSMPWDVGALTSAQIAQYEERLTDEQIALFQTFRKIAHDKLTEFKEAELKENEIARKMMKKLTRGHHKIEFKNPVTGKLVTMNVIKQ